MNFNENYPMSDHGTEVIIIPGGGSQLGGAGFAMPSQAFGGFGMPSEAYGGGFAMPSRAYGGVGFPSAAYGGAFGAPDVEYQEEYMRALREKEERRLRKDRLNVTNQLVWRTV